MQARAAQSADFFARAQLWFAYASYLNIVFLLEGLVHVFAFLTALSEMGQKGRWTGGIGGSLRQKSTLSFF